MSRSVAVQPTGLERIVGPDQLFFSTTDRSGVIRSGNSVFAGISGYSLAELTHAPHSIIRHPEMPAGAFRLMWDRLLAGRPMGAFVKNLASDGSHYWVFATVTPLGDGFLSVRMAPCSALLQPAQNLYLRVRAAEREAMERDGFDRRSAAQWGARLIEEGIRGLGFDSYDDFILEALPAEIASRPRPASLSSLRSRTQGPIAQILLGTETLEGLLVDLVALLDTYRALSERLLGAATRVLEVARRLELSVVAAQRASEEVVGSAPVLLNVATVMAQPMHIAVIALEQLAPRLHQLRSDVAALRFRIALASLHNDMVAAFAAEVAVGGAPPSALAEVPLLCDAVHDGVLDMARTAQAVNAELADAEQQITETVGHLDEFRRFLGQWRILVMRHRAGHALGELLGPIDSEIATSHDSFDMLESLGAQCRSATVPIQVAAMQAQLDRIRNAATQR